MCTNTSFPPSCGLDEAIALRRIEPLHGARRHARSPEGLTSNVYSLAQSATTEQGPGRPTSSDFGVSAGPLENGASEGGCGCNRPSGAFKIPSWSVGKTNHIIGLLIDATDGRNTGPRYSHKISSGLLAASQRCPSLLLPPMTIFLPPLLTRLNHGDRAKRLGGDFRPIRCPPACA